MVSPRTAAANTACAWINLTMYFGVRIESASWPLTSTSPLLIEMVRVSGDSVATAPG